MNEFEWKDRIRRLPPEKRKLLALRLYQLEGADPQHAHSQADQDLRLIAYVVPSQPGAVDGSELRRRLGEKLPAYMIPSQFVVLESLPLTPNGKVDLNRLPPPETTKSAGDGASMASDSPPLAGLSNDSWIEPRNEVERTVAKIWTELLGMEVLSVEDNFFELGGHSLLVMRMLAQLRQQYGVEIAASDFFQAPTIANLALLIQALRLVQSPPIGSTDEPRESFEL